MNKDKVYLKGYVVGRAADTLGYQGLMVQLENLDIVEIDKNLVHRDINEPQPIKLKDIIKRINGLDEDSKNYWLDSIVNWFSLDFGLVKYKQGYEQGKFDGSMEREKVTVPQYVADWIEEAKKHCKDVSDLFDFDFTNEEVGNWFLQEKPFDLVARAWLDGYEIEKEKRYYVRFKFIEDSYSYLTLIKHLNAWTVTNIKLDKKFRSEHTRKELEEAGFGWVFDCPGIEIEEVEE